MSERNVTVVSAVNPQTQEPLIGNAVVHLGDGSIKVQFTNGRALVPESVAREFLARRNDLLIPEIGHMPEGAQPGGGVIIQAATPESLVHEGPPEGMNEDELRAAVRAGERAQDQLEERKRAESVAQERHTPLEERPAEKPAERGVPAANTADEQRSEDERNAARQPSAADREYVEQLEREGEVDPDQTREAPEPSAPIAEGPAGADVEPVTEAPAESEVEKTDPRQIPAGFEAKTAEGEDRCLAKKADGTQCKNPAHEGGSACSLDSHQRQFAVEA